MANTSYLWQIIRSMQEATLRLEEALKQENQREVLRLKSFIFDLQQTVNKEVDENGK